MLNIFGPSTRFCDGVTRRSFLKIGAFAFGATALTLADIFRAEAAQPAPPRPGTRRSSTSSSAAARRTRTCGTSRPRPRPRSAASSSRSPPTSPASRSARSSRASPRMMDKFVVIRSVVGASGGHDAYPVHDRLAAASRCGRWAAGRASAPSSPKLQGPVDPSVPPFVGLAAPTQHVPWSDPGQPGFLGTAYAPVQAGRPGHGEHDAQRRHPRPARRPPPLLAELRRPAPRHRRQRHARRAWTPPTERALGVLTSSKLLDALDLSQGEPDRSASATATASRTSSSTTAPRRSTTIC